MNTEKGIGHYKGWFQTKQGKPARVLLDIKSRGLVHAHALAVRDWVVGFWGAITEGYPNTVPPCYCPSY